MSNICRRCGSLIEYSLVPLSSIRNNHCHFCIREFKSLTDKLNKERESAFADFRAKLKKEVNGLEEGDMSDKHNTNLDKFVCIHCGEVYVRHQLRTTFCDNCGEILKVKKAENAKLES